MNACGGDVFCKLLDDHEGIARQRWPSVRMIFVHKSQRAVRLDTIRKIRIAARNQNQVALESAVFVDRACSVNAGMKAIVRTKFRKDRTLRQRLRGGSRHEKFGAVQRVNDFARVQ